MSDRDATKTLTAQLERHYINPAESMPGGLFVREVGLNGVASGRRCDALYVGFTSASGRILVGHEVKVSRSDWLRELAKVGKADTWADACHAWYIVAPPGVVKLDELPDGWGLLEPSPRLRTRLAVVVKARVRHDLTPPWDAVRSLLARSDTLRAEAMREFRQHAEDEAQAAAEQRFALRAERQASALTPDQAAKLKAVARFEELYGVSLVSSAWGTDHVEPGQLAAALAIVKASRRLPNVEHLLRSAEGAATSAKALREAVEEWRAVAPR
jgi:PAS domain-containing protein